MPLPLNPLTGKPRAGPGRPRLLPDKVVRLAKDQTAEAFEKIGGVDGLVKWIEESRHNRKLFYTVIWPRLMPAQALEAAAQKLSEAPVITKIENVIVTATDGRIVESAVPSTSARDRTVEDVPYVDVTPAPEPERPTPERPSEPSSANRSRPASALTPEQIEAELAAIEEQRRRIRGQTGTLAISRAALERAEKRRVEEEAERKRDRTASTPDSWY